MAILNNSWQIDDFKDYTYNQWLNAFENIYYSINVPFLIAQDKDLPLIIGRGVIFKSDNERILKFLNDWKDKVDLDDKLKRAILQFSILGNSIMYLEEKNGFIDILNNNQLLIGREALVDNRIQLAVLYSYASQGDNVNLYKITFSNKSIKYEPISTDTDNKGNLKVQAQGEVATIDKELERKRKTIYQSNPFSKVPVVMFYNSIPLNLLYFANSKYMRACPSWWFARKEILQLQKLIDISYTEAEKNQTRVYGNFDQNLLSNIHNGTIRYNELLGDFFINSNTSTYMSGNSSTNQGLLIQEGNPAFEKYQQEIEARLTRIYRQCGYEYKKGSSTYENKTKSMFEVEIDYQTSSRKQVEFKNKLFYLIDLVLERVGLSPFKNGVRDYDIEFLTSSILDKLTEHEIINTRLTNNTISRVEAIQKLDNLDRISAMRKVEEIDKDKVINNEMVSDINSNSDYNNNLSKHKTQNIKDNTIKK